MKNLLHTKKNENSKFIVQSSNAIVFISAKRWSCCIQNEFLKQVFSTPVTNKKKEKNWNMEIMNNLGNKHTSLTSELVFFCVPLESSRSDINRDYYYVRTYSAAFLFPENQNKSHTLVEIAFIGNFPASSFRVHSDWKSACEANFCCLSISLLTISFDTQREYAKTFSPNRFSSVICNFIWSSKTANKNFDFFAILIVWFDVKCRWLIYYFLIILHRFENNAFIIKMCHNLHSCHSKSFHYS